MGISLAAHVPKDESSSYVPSRFGDSAHAANIS